MQLSVHFNLADLTRSDTATRHGIDNTPGPAEVENLRALANNVLDWVATFFGRDKVIINSGYRGPGLNAIIGGSKNSQHCKGQAADIEVVGVSNYALANWIATNLKFDQLILEFHKAEEPTSGWVHVSWAPTLRREILRTRDGKTYHRGLD
jgi:zinc D-Ala-D-Ala carboxypeptidase